MISSRQMPIDAEDGIDIVAVFRVLWRYKYLVALIALLGGGVAVYLALTADEIYRAEVVVTDVRDGNLGGGASLAGQLGGLASLAGVNLAAGAASARDAQAVLASHRLVEEFIKREKLVPQLIPSQGKVQTLWFAVKRFRESVLSVHQDKLTGVTTVSVDWTDPVVAARWANELAALANELMRTRAINEASRNIAYLKDQIARTNVVELQRVMYDLIETQTKTLMLASGRVEYAFNIVDPAVPPEMRSSPKRTMMLLTGLVLGAFLGALLAFALNLRARYKHVP